MLLRSIAKSAGIGIAASTAVIIIAVLATARRGDPEFWPPAPGTAVAEVLVISHGYHSGVLLPRRTLLEAAERRGLTGLVHVARRFSAFELLEFGWGDERFYREVPTATALTVTMAARALLRPGNASVLHVVGLGADPRAAFPHSDLLRLPLGAAGLERMLERLEASLASVEGMPQELGPGLYGSSFFYRATGTFNLFNVCNHWVADLLDAAGVPTAPVPAILPAGLLLDLEWRSGLTRLPPRRPAPQRRGRAPATDTHPRALHHRRRNGLLRKGELFRP
jgi:uncharacterized protein (TIGR02117 family)